MIRLFDIDEDNWLAVRRLSAADDQKGYLDTAEGILARGYVYRAARARVIGIADGETVVGVALVKDLDEEPACYDLQQFLIDRRFQNRGFGTQALRLITAELAAERKYDCVEVCVKNTDAPALRLYEKCGFRDTGYVDPDVPDCLNLRLEF